MSEHEETTRQLAKALYAIDGQIDTAAEYEKLVALMVDAIFCSSSEQAAELNELKERVGVLRSALLHTLLVVGSPASETADDATLARTPAAVGAALADLQSSVDAESDTAVFRGRRVSALRAQIRSLIKAGSAVKLSMVQVPVDRTQGYAADVCERAIVAAAQWDAAVKEAEDGLNSCGEGALRGLHGHLHRARR